MSNTMAMQDATDMRNMRKEYLNTDREALENMAEFDVLARATLVLLDALEESKRKRESLSPIGFKYTDPSGRVITIVSEDPVKDPGYYLVERDDGAQWGVSAELLESVSPYEAWCIEQGIESKESEQ